MKRIFVFSALLFSVALSGCSASSGSDDQNSASPFGDQANVATGLPDSSVFCGDDTFKSKMSEFMAASSIPVGRVSSYYISTTGSDDADGTKDAPLKTFEH